MIFCKNCGPDLADCDFCLYAAHDYWKDENGKIHCGDLEYCMLHKIKDPGVCNDFHCFREPWEGRKRKWISFLN